MAVVAELNGNLFVLESGGTTRGYEEEVLVHLANVAKRWKVNACIPEPNYGDGMFTSLLKPVMARVWPCTVEEAPRSAGQKERRIVDVLGPLSQQHRLVFSSELIQKDWTGAERDPDTGHQRSLMYQLSRITADRGCLSFYDRIDALAIGCSYFVDAAAQDQQRAQQQRADEIDDWSRQAWMDETGASVDALALGFRPMARSAAYGGVRRR